MSCRSHTSFIKSLSSSLKSLWKASPSMKPSGNCWAAWEKHNTAQTNIQFTLLNYPAIYIHLNNSLSAVRLHVDSTHDLQEHVHRHSLPEQTGAVMWSETGVRVNVCRESCKEVFLHMAFRLSAGVSSSRTAQHLERSPNTQTPPDYRRLNWHLHTDHAINN